MSVQETKEACLDWRSLRLRGDPRPVVGLVSHLAIADRCAGRTQADRCAGRTQ